MAEIDRTGMMLGWLVGRRIAAAMKATMVDYTTLAPGLYTVGTGQLVTPWADLVESGIVSVTDGVFQTQSSGELAGVLVMSGDAGIATLSKTAFRSCGELVGVVIPEGVTTINNGSTYGDGAFTGCSKLAWVSLPSTLTTIGTAAFKGCVSLADVAIPEGVTTIGSAAFKECESLTEIALPSSFAGTLGWFTFLGCSRLRTITMPPDGITSISSNAFNDCVSLTSLHLPASLEYFDDTCIDGCTSLSAITVDDENTNFVSVDGILYNKEMTDLHRYPPNKAGNTFEVPDGVVTVYSRAFLESGHLKSISIPASVTALAGSSFMECPKLEEVVIDSDNPNFVSMNGILFSADMTEMLYYPTAKTGESYTVPEGVTVLGSYAFNFVSALKNIVVASTVTELEWRAICEMPVLETVEFLSDAPPSLYNSASLSIYGTSVQVIVPKGCKSAYLNAFSAVSDITDHVIEKEE